jgi:predicted ArsR family transcriptional regulator
MREPATRTQARRAQILKLLEGAKSQGRTTAQIAQALGLSKSPYLRTLLADMVADGVIIAEWRVIAGVWGFRFWAPEYEPID